jgi:hypothetical protein
MKTMHGTKETFLNLHTPPARLNANEAAWYLGFKPHEVSMLVSAGLLTPLGRPARNRPKFFAAETLQQLRRDEKWLARATDAIATYWRRRNARKKIGKKLHKNGSEPRRPPVVTSQARIGGSQ